MKTRSGFKTALIFVILTISFGDEARSQVEISAFKLGLDHRTRFTSWDNAIDLDDGEDSQNTYTRHRSNLSLSWVSNINLEVFVKLTNEFRYYFQPDDKTFHLHELIFDNAYLRWNRPLGLPVFLTLGRQNIMMGEGFVVMDGHPLDGSRSFYFNAVRLDYGISEDRTVTFFYTYQTTTDDQLPIIHDQNQPLIEQPEEGIGLYYSGKHGRSKFEAYAIRKNIKHTESRPISSGINTGGLRFAAFITDRLGLTAETAYQFGSYGGFKRHAFGGYFHFDYERAESILLPRVTTIGSIFLSGDDPATDRMEAWDPLFSRWPKWSYSYLYTLIRENDGKPAYWSNFVSAYGSLYFKFGDRLDLTVTAHRLFAMQKSFDALYLSGEGKNRGSLIITRVGLKISKSTSSHLVWDVFVPGNFYVQDADGYHYLHFQVVTSLSIF